MCTLCYYYSTLVHFTLYCAGDDPWLDPDFRRPHGEEIAGHQRRQLLTDAREFEGKLQRLFEQRDTLLGSAHKAQLLQL